MGGCIPIDAAYVPNPAGFVPGERYWAYFTAASFEMVPSSSATTSTVPLETGYAAATSLSPGQAVWVYSANGGTAYVQARLSTVDSYVAPGVTRPWPTVQLYVSS
jgi:hypothetical protein